jgi:D-aminopeptidase
MTEKTFWESFKAESEGVIEKLKALIHEGNVRRVVIQHQGRSVAEFPLTAGVVGALLAPVVAAIGAIVALLKDCTIQVERVDSAAREDQRPPKAAAG